jgi:hypothetical protein
METGNVDLVLSEITADECNEAAEELARYLDAGLLATRKLLAAFLNDLNNECLTRWGRGAKRPTGRCARIRRVGLTVSNPPHTRWRRPAPRTCDSSTRAAGHRPAERSTSGPCSLGAEARALSPLVAPPIDRLEFHACQPRQTRPA